MKERSRAPFHWLGQVEYRDAWALQAALVKQRQRGRIDDTVLFLEHPHVYTLGRRGRMEHVLLDEEALSQAGVTVHRTDRGGEVTYHGPGQLVGYPIVDVRKVGGPGRYVRALEEALVAALATFGLPARRMESMPGVCIGEPRNERKIAAIGLRVSRGVGSHGFALNVSTELDYFRHIVPCGVPDLPMTSMERELGAAVDAQAVREAVARALAGRLELDAAWAAEQETTALLASPAVRGQPRPMGARAGPTGGR